MLLALTGAIATLPVAFERGLHIMRPIAAEAAPSSAANAARAIARICAPGAGGGCVVWLCRVMAPDVLRSARCRRATPSALGGTRLREASMTAPRVICGQVPRLKR